MESILRQALRYFSAAEDDLLGSERLSQPALAEAGPVGEDESTDPLDHRI